MSDGPKKALAPLAWAGRPDPVASPNLSLVASRSAARVDRGLLALLETALLVSDRSERVAALHDMMAAGVSRDQVVDSYIPAAARRLGELWFRDEVSFVDVTIGTARLQSILRDLGPDWAQETTSDPMAPNVLLVVRQETYHTLGAMVAADQLRRVGVSVRLALGLGDDDAAEIVASKRFDAVMISASASESLESMSDLVEKIRRAMRPVAPIVVGGTILDTDRDAKVITGADFVTSVPQEALRLCGLKASAYDAQSFLVRM